MRVTRYLGIALVASVGLGSTGARALLMPSARAQDESPEESPGEVEVEAAPPAPQVETIVIEKRPSPSHVWIHGHWAWRGRWHWVPGHWHAGRPGQFWVAGHWEQRGSRFHWVAGSWVEEVKVTEERPGLLEATVAPPAPMNETVVIQLRPSAKHVWIPGHWAWHGHWQWEHGHWHLAREGSHWTPGHWFHREGRWHWEPGKWVVEAEVVAERPGELIATEAPPAPYQETVLVETRPSSNHVWINGHWAWHGHWQWEHGHWLLGKEGSRWVQGHWYAKEGRWHWEPGRWVVEEQVVEERPGELVAAVAPPAPYQETIMVETRPSPNHVWINGHWAWHGHWQWEHGHWHVGHPGSLWVQGHWYAKDGRWHWAEGRWVEEVKVTEERPGELVATEAPPPPPREVEIVELRPSPRHVWIAGHWAWHGHWQWEHGHWHLGHEGNVWVSGRWEERGGRWHWVGGTWRAR